MPSLEAPAYYGRAKEVAPDEYDHFFKWLPHEFYESITSTVECPLGWVGLVNVDQSAKKLHDVEMTRAGVEGGEDYPYSGWYIVRITDDGIVFGIYYGVNTQTLPEEAARADFAEAERAYDEWDAGQ